MSNKLHAATCPMKMKVTELIKKRHTLYVSERFITRQRPHKQPPEPILFLLVIYCWLI